MRRKVCELIRKKRAGQKCETYANPHQKHSTKDNADQSELFFRDLLLIIEAHKHSNLRA